MLRLRPLALTGDLRSVTLRHKSHYNTESQITRMLCGDGWLAEGECRVTFAYIIRHFFLLLLLSLLFHFLSFTLCVPTDTGLYFIQFNYTQEKDVRLKRYPNFWIKYQFIKMAHAFPNTTFASYFI